MLFIIGDKDDGGGGDNCCYEDVQSRGRIVTTNKPTPRLAIVVMGN